MNHQEQERNTKMQQPKRGGELGLPPQLSAASGNGAANGKRMDDGPLRKNEFISQLRTPSAGRGSAGHN